MRVLRPGLSTLVLGVTLLAVWFSFTGLMGFGLYSVLSAPAGPQQSADQKIGGRQVYRIDVEGVIAPATARYIQRAIREAETRRAEALLIRLDTPGGLMKSMGDMTRAMLNAQVPVIVFVAPEGAHAASAGVFVTYAAHIAAMAPATRIGAAHPVGVGQGDSPESKTMIEKATEDAVAQIRGIAKRRGRNIEWAEKAVRQSVSADAEVALELKVIDVIARDVEDLLQKVDGRIVTVGNEQKTLQTKNATVVPIPMDVTESFLRMLSDPNVGFILLNIGIIGILAELYNPGAILPGVVGAISIVLGLASFAILEVNVAGLLLIALAILMFIADIKVPGHGVLTVGGVISFVFGAILLTDRQAPFLRISIQLILVIAAAMAAFFLFAVGAGIRAQRVRPQMEKNDLLGAVGVVRSDLEPEGTVYVQGELWTARAESGPIHAGERVEVTGLDGLHLRVRPAG